MSEADTSQETTSEEPVVDASQVVADAVAETPSEEVKEWFLSEGVKGEGEPPDYFKADKYKTLADQAKAYIPLESQFGAFTGAPEKYEVNISEELKERGIAIDPDNHMLQAAMEFAKAKNMNQDGFDGMVETYLVGQVAEQEAMEEYKAEQFKALGDNAKGRVDNLALWANKHLPVENQEGFKALAHSADAVKALESIVAMTRPGAMAPSDVTPSTAVSRSDVEAMQFATDDNGNRKIQTDPAFKAEYERLKNEVYGLEPYRKVIG